MIVVGLVVPGETTGSVGIRPEAFLKGSALPADILLQPPTDDCPPAKLQAGDRVLAFLAGSDGQLRWPGASQAWTLDAGQAQNGAGDSRTEANLVSQVRSVTGQYAVPAPTSDTGIRITWKGTILPLAAALALVFGVGLVLMRTWHRIDPT